MEDKVDINFITGRKLGSIEKFIWLNDSNRSSHFSIAGEIAGRLSPSQLRLSLRSLAPSLVNASGRIIKDPNGDPRFSQSLEDIELRVIEDTTIDIGRVFEDELAKPFKTDRGPLLRCILMLDGSRSALVLTAHHAVADGMSLTFLLRNLMMNLSTKAIATTPAGKSLEDRLSPTPKSDGLSDNQDSGTARLPKAYRDKAAAPHVETLGLSRKESQALISAARANDTTVQTALSAAVSKVLSRSMKAADGGPLRIMTPLDARKRLLDGTEDLAVLIAGCIVTDPGQTTDPWDRARGFDAALSHLRVASGTAIAIEALANAMKHISTVEDASNFFATAMGSEILLTNLGNLAIPSSYGDLILERVWGPAVTLGFDQEQSVGVTALDGIISLVYTSVTPVKGMLLELRSELERMCSAYGLPSSGSVPQGITSRPDGTADAQ